MTQRQTLKHAIAAWVLALSAASAPCLLAEEPAQDFLDGLRERGYYEYALEYLDRMEKSPMAPVEFKQSLAYERGLTLIMASKTNRNARARDEQLTEAQTCLQQFIRQQPKHPRVATAKSQLGNVLVEQARSKVEDAKKGNQAALLKEARALYDQAYEVFDKSVEQLRASLKGIPTNIDPKNTKQIEIRDQLRADYLQVQVLRAVIREEMADTESPGSAAYNTLLEDAAKQFAEINTKYRTRLAGLYSQMYQGRVYLKLKKFDDALTLFEELFEQPEDPGPFRTLRTKTLILAMQCWLDPKLKKYTEAIDKASPWVAGARPAEQSLPEWLELKLELARANKLHGEAQRAKKATDPPAGSLFREARKLATEISHKPNAFQKAARELLAQIPGGSANEDDEDKLLKTFADAKTAGREALDAMQTAKASTQLLPKLIAKEKDEARKQELEEQLKAAQESLPAVRDEALRHFRKALSLATQETPTDDINVVRYFLCYLFYLRGDYYEAAMLGQFLSERYPDSTGARQCAKIAMASYLKLYADNPEENKDFETQKVIQVCDYIANKWPSEPEAEEALSTLILFMIKAGKLDEAVQYLKSIPEDSPRRGLSELKTGQAMWSGYLRGMQELRKWRQEGPPPNVDQAAKEQELQQLKLRAEKVLADGVERMKTAGTVDETMFAAVLSLSQIYVDTDRPIEAVKLLEAEKVGALTLVDTKHPAAAKDGVAEETYKTALRAYISSLGKVSGAEADRAIDSAKRVMNEMSQTMDSQKVQAIHIGIAHDLQQSMEAAPSETIKASLAKGFEIFLQQISLESNEFSVLNWVADTFFSMGNGYVTGAGAAPPQAVRYFDLSNKTYEKMLSGSVPDKYRIQIQLRMAMILKKLGKYEEAIDLFLRILEERNLLLNVQLEAAQTFHDWGVAAQDPEKFQSAIRGYKYDKKLRKGIIWGWNQISKITAGKAQFRETFYQARYNQALSRYEQAKAEDPKERLATLLQAKKDISLTEQWYPLGPESSGQTLEADFDRLLKQIQTALKEKPGGLQAIREEASDENNKQTS